VKQERDDSSMAVFLREGRSNLPQRNYWNNKCDLELFNLWTLSIMQCNTKNESPLMAAYGALLNNDFLCKFCFHYTGRFIVFSVITNIYNKKTKRPTLMEFFTARGKLKKFFFDN